MPFHISTEYERSDKSWYEASQLAYDSFFLEEMSSSTSSTTTEPLDNTPLFPPSDPTPAVPETRASERPQRSRQNERRSRRTLGRPSPAVVPVGDFISNEERDLRIAEASILFPKYMQKHSAKRARGLLVSEKRKSGVPQLPYLPSAEYVTQWEPDDYECAPQMDQNKLDRALHFFRQDCQHPGKPVAESMPNPFEYDPECYDLEWNQRLNWISHNPIIEPPEKGSLDDTPIIPSTRKGIKPENMAAYDSFVLQLKREMGPDYIDLASLRYFPRSDGRIPRYKKSKKKIMKNAMYDVDIFIRNRDIDRCIQGIKLLYEIRRMPWNDEIAEEWEQRIIHFVDPEKVCHGRSSLYADGSDELSPEPFDQKSIEAPAGMREDDFGTKFFWSVREGGRMVSFDELRQKQRDAKERDAISQSPTFEGMGTRSKSRSPPK